MIFVCWLFPPSSLKLIELFSELLNMGDKLTFKSITTRVFLFSHLLLSPAYATEVSAKAIAFACSGCHGSDGQFDKPGLPRLKSRNRQALEKSLLDYKYDRKSASIMGRITKGYTDAELKAVAEYFSDLK